MFNFIENNIIYSLNKNKKNYLFLFFKNKINSFKNINQLDFFLLLKKKKLISFFFFNNKKTKKLIFILLNTNFFFEVNFFSNKKINNAVSNFFKGFCWYEREVFENSNFIFLKKKDNRSLLKPYNFYINNNKNIKYKNIKKNLTFLKKNFIFLKC